MKPKPDYDRLFKELRTTFFLDFIALFFPSLRATLGANSLELLDQEVFTDLAAGTTITRLR